MNFRRSPFSFSSINPAERQAELQRKFGVPSSGNMLIENRNYPSMDNSSQSSPRLQHRIPVMNYGYPAKVEREGYADNVDSASTHEPKVRIIPIHVEGRDIDPQIKHRNLSEESVPFTKANQFSSEGHDSHQTKSGLFFPTINSEFRPSSFGTEARSQNSKNKFSHSKIKQPKVHNVSVAEGQDGGEKLKHCRSVPIQKEFTTKKQPKMGNGPCVSKSATEPSVSKAENTESDIKASLKKIETILEQFKTYESRVQNFSGTQSDKEYCYLDEMMTRCMIKLDDVETFDNEDVRKSRKEAVKRIQKSVHDLDSKVQPKENNETNFSDDSENYNLDVKDVEIKSDAEITENGKTFEKMISSEEKLSSSSNNLISNQENLTMVTINDLGQNNTETNIVENEVPDLKCGENLIGSNELNLNSDSVTKDSRNNDIPERGLINDSNEGTETCKSDCTKNSLEIDFQNKKLAYLQDTKIDMNDVEMEDLTSSDNQIALSAES